MNRKIILALSLCAALMLSLLAGCSQPQDNSASPAAPGTPAATMAPTEAPAPAAESVLADGEYTAKFLTDSSMFHVNETLNDEGKLTVKDGQMTIHVTLAGDSILNL
ncbi:MAG: iron transporter, partial [Parasporobacterium sp.]|nr:iron transporter [Parasporobacterium sp.]